MLFNIASSYFEYSRTERFGTTMLVFIILLTYSFPAVYRSVWQPDPIDFTRFHTSFRPANPVAEYVPKEQTVAVAPPAFAFDPNTASEATLVELGFPRYLAARLVRYRSRGGAFRRPEDLGKLYGIQPDLVERLVPFVQIANPEPERKFVRQPPPADRRNNRQPRKTAPPSPFAFDPNVATPRDFVRLGLSESLARQILNYRDKGGRFRRPEDFQKIYNLKPTDYERLLPFITIPPPPPVDSTAVAAERRFVGHRAASNRTAEPIDVNAATVEDWQQLRGVGPYYAKRIVGFRTALGGFVSVAQIGETYHLPDSVFQRIQPQLRFERPPGKIDVNAVDAETLKGHPYLRWRQAKAIVNYRTQHGPFESAAAFGVMREALGADYERILPYLEFKTPRS